MSHGNGARLVYPKARACLYEAHEIDEIKKNNGLMVFLQLETRFSWV